MTPQQRQLASEQVRILKAEVKQHYNFDVESFFSDLAWYYDQEELVFCEIEQFLFLMALTVQSQQRVSSILGWNQKTVTQRCSRQLFKHIKSLFRTKADVNWNSIHRIIIENGEYIDLPSDQQLAST
jgi:DNA-binding protein Fis